MSWLYRYETKGIQSWILDSNMLRDLAGGSALVEELTKRAKQRAEGARGKVAQATSGAMTAVFETLEDLESFASAWPLEMSLRAPGLQLVQAWVDHDSGLDGLFERIAATRNTIPLDDIESGPWVLRAGKSGLPAVPSPKIRSKARPTTLDATAVAKERANDDLSSEPGVVTGGHPWNAFNTQIEDWKDTEGPVAVVHADGTGVGQRLRNLGLGDLAAFSSALKAATTAAVERAIEKLPRGRGIDGRPIVSAGDDLTYIVPASCARAFAAEWLRALEEETARQPVLGGKMSGGAGIVIVHRKHPFAQAYEMAEELCSAAKNRLKAMDEAATSVVAFKRITTSWVENVTHNALGWRLHVDDALEGLAKAVVDLPRGTLRTWLTYFEQGDERATQLWQRAREVAPQEAWKAFEQALAVAGADPRTGTLQQDSRAAVNLDDTARPTPIRDAIALRYFEKEAR